MRRYAVVALLAGSFGVVAWVYGAWRVEAARRESDLAQALRRVRDERWLVTFERNRGRIAEGDLFGNCREVSRGVREAAAVVLLAQGEDSRRQLTIVAPEFGHDQFLMLWRNRFFYVDVRPRPDIAHLTVGRSLLGALARGSYRSGFAEGFSEGHTCARSVKVMGRDVVVAVSGEASPLSALFSW